MWNYATISGGTFNGSIGNMESAVIRGADGSVPQINGNIYFNQSEARILQPCAFGANASVTVEYNDGIIQVPMTVNGESRNFNFGDNVLDALNVIRSGADWCAVEGDKRTPVTAEAAFGLQRCSYDYTYYVEGSILFITAPVEVTGDMLEGISIVHVTATGEITGGTLNSDSWIDIAVNGVISGGTFSGNMGVDYWYGEITGGTFAGVR